MLYFYGGVAVLKLFGAILTTQGTKPIPFIDSNPSRQPTLSLQDLCLEVLTV